MTPNELPGSGTPAGPTWSELAAFIRDQANNDRGVIDYWFKLAAALFGIIIIVGGGLLGFFGWRTYADAQATAANIAREAARARVEEVLKQPEVQVLVRETAHDLLSRGEFREAIETKARALIVAQMASAQSQKIIADGIRTELTSKLAWRTLTPSQSKMISDTLQSIPSGQISVRPGGIGEPQSYGRKIFSALKGSPSWREHVSYAAPGSWAGLTATGDEVIEALGPLGGIAIVINDPRHPSDAARELEAALKGAGVANVRISGCECANPPKPLDLWLYVLEKVY